MPGCNGPITNPWATKPLCSDCVRPAMRPKCHDCPAMGTLMRAVLAADVERQSCLFSGPQLTLLVQEPLVVDELTWGGAGAVPSAAELAEYRAATAAALRPTDSSFCAACSTAYRDTLQERASQEKQLAVLAAEQLPLDAGTGAFGSDPGPMSAGAGGAPDADDAVRAAAAAQRVTIPMRLCSLAVQTRARLVALMACREPPPLQAAHLPLPMQVSLCALQLLLLHIFLTIHTCGRLCRGSRAATS